MVSYSTLFKVLPTYRLMQLKWFVHTLGRGGSVLCWSRDTAFLVLLDARTSVYTVSGDTVKTEPP